MRKKTQDEFELELKILTEGRVTLNGKYEGCSKKADFKCDHGHEFTAFPSNILRRKSCPVCSNKIVLVGFNDISTTRPDIACLLKYKEDGLRYTEHSNSKVWFVCPHCGKELYKDINHVSYRGLSCDRCSDGISYPNKFIRNLLKQLKVDYIPEYNLKSGKYFYDVYIKDINMIIEMHGEQHYTGWCNDSNDLENVVENDNNKRQFASSCGVKYYIVIDSSKSDVEFLSKNILNSKLTDVFDLSNVDWNKCDFDSRKSLFVEFVNLFNNGISRNEIMDLLQVGDTTMCRWLKQANNANLLTINNGHFLRGAKSVILLNTKEIFSTISEASKTYNIQKTQISSVCKRRSLYAGIHPDIGHPMVWRYLDEYDENEVIDFNSIRINSRSNSNNTKLIKEVS